MPNRAGYVQQDERDKDVGSRHMRAIEEGVDPLVVYAPWRQLDRVEVLHAPLAEVRCHIPSERHDQHARVQRQMGRVRADPFPCGHAVRQRRRWMEPAPACAENDRDTERHADGLVQVHVPAARRRPRGNLLQVPAERYLRENDQRDQPMQRDCGARVAGPDIARMSLLLRRQARPLPSPHWSRSGPSAPATGNRMAPGAVLSAARAPRPSGPASRPTR